MSPRLVLQARAAPPLGGGFSLRTEYIAFGLEPVIELVAVLAAAGFIEFVGAEADLFFQLSGIRKCAGRFGALCRVHGGLRFLRFEGDCYAGCARGCNHPKLNPGGLYS